MFRRLFTDHPASLGESYAQHLRAASGFGVQMIAGGAACILHALVPAWFESTGSRAVDRLHTRMVRNRAAQRDALADGQHGSWVI